MDVVAALLACSLYGDDALVRAIVQSASRSDPYFVLDLTIDASQMTAAPEPRSAGEAVARARAIRASGGRAVLGLMQLTPEAVASFGRSTEDAFNPCLNIAMGSALLSQFDDECAVEKREDPAHTGREPQRREGVASRRDCVLLRYGRETGSADFVTVTKLELQFQRPIDLPSHLAGAPLLFDGNTGPSWGPDGVLVRTAGPQSVHGIGPTERARAAR